MYNAYIMIRAWFLKVTVKLFIGAAPGGTNPVGPIYPEFTNFSVPVILNFPLTGRYVTFLPVESIATGL
jgi:hypothetical protein